MTKNMMLKGEGLARPILRCRRNGYFYDSKEFSRKRNS